MPLCIVGCPRELQQGLGLQPQKDGPGDSVWTGLRFVLTQVPRWVPQTHPLQTMNKKKYTGSQETNVLTLFMQNTSTRI